MGQVVGSLRQEHSDQISSHQVWQVVDTACQISAIEDVREFCQAFLLESLAIAGADAGTFYLVRGQNQKTVLQLQALAHGSELLPMDHNQHLPIDCWRGDRACTERVAVHATVNKESLKIDNALATDRYDFLQEEILSVNPLYEIETVLVIPVLTQTDDVIGLLQLVNAHDSETGEKTFFTDSSRQLLETLSSLISVPLSSLVSSTEHRGMLVRLSGEPNLEKLFDRILWEAQVITGAEGGTLYLVNDQGDRPVLEFKVFHNYALDIRNYFSKDRKVQNKPIPMTFVDGSPNFANVASYAANLKQTVNIADAYETSDFDFTGTKAFDAMHDYASHSFLTVPLMNHDDEVIGVLQLINARDFGTKKIESFSKHHEDIVKALAGYAAIALNNQLLIDEHKKFLDAFVKCMAQAIDAKSSHTGLHCQRVPVLTEMIAQACCVDRDTLPEFDLNDDEWYELHVAGWLHDCGKLGTPDQILNKSTKLDLMRDTVEDIYHRLEIVKREKQIELLRHPCCHPLQAICKAYQFYQFAMMINDEKDFIGRINIGGERMSGTDQERVCAIAERVWYDDAGKAHAVLTEEEVDYLCIQRGTLSMEERKRINDHIILTIDMLESLPFPKKLRRVPEFAGGHHEKIDGTGYPKGLTGEELSLPARMMAIADIFEALTASDRPYKKPMGLSKALGILQQMRDNKHIDPQVYHVFLTGRVWESYAKEFLSPAQLDIKDIQDYL